MKTDGNGQVYPGVGVNDQDEYGLSKREYFAAKALQGYIASDLYSNASYETVCEYAVQAADVLIKELNKNGK